MTAQSTKMTTSLGKALLPSHRRIRIHLCLFYSSVSNSTRALVRNASSCVQVLDCEAPYGRAMSFIASHNLLFFQFLTLFLLVFEVVGGDDSKEKIQSFIIDFHLKSAIKNLCTCALDLTVVL